MKRNEKWNIRWQEKGDEDVSFSLYFNAEQTNDLYSMSTVGLYKLNYFLLKKPSSINFMQTLNIYNSFFSWNFPLMKKININSGCRKVSFISAMFQNVVFKYKSRDKGKERKEDMMNISLFSSSFLSSQIIFIFLNLNLLLFDKLISFLKEFSCCETDIVALFCLLENVGQ